MGPLFNFGGIIKTSNKMNKIKLLGSIIMLLLTYFPSLAQNDEIFEKTYQFKIGINIQPCQHNGQATGLPATSNKGDYFEVVGIVNDTTFIIQYTPWGINKNGSIRSWNEDDSTQNLKWIYSTALNQTLDIKDRYFLITKRQLDLYAKDIARTCSLVIGALSLPIKLRLSGDDGLDRRNKAFREIGSDFNVGATIGISLRKKTWESTSVNFTIGAGISSIKVDSTTSLGLLKTATDVTALSPTFNITLVHNDFNFSLSTGIDIVGGELATKWVYRNKPWIGIGLGYNLFKATDGKAAKQPGS
jgi:hypothetical protein